MSNLTIFSYSLVPVEAPLETSPDKFASALHDLLGPEHLTSNNKHAVFTLKSALYLHNKMYYDATAY